MDFLPRDYDTYDRNMSKKNLKKCFIFFREKSLLKPIIKYIEVYQFFNCYKNNALRWLPSWDFDYSWLNLKWQQHTYLITNKVDGALKL